MDEHAEVMRPGTYEIWVSTCETVEEAHKLLWSKGWRAMSHCETILPEDVGAPQDTLPRFRFRGAVLVNGEVWVSVDGEKRDATITGRRLDSGGG